MCRTAGSLVVRILAVAVFWACLSAGQIVQAGTMYSITITATPPPDDVNKDYDGNWVFSVGLNDAKTMIEFTVISGNTGGNTKTFKGDTYSYAVTNKDGVYSFSGSSLGSLPISKDYDLGMAGSYTLASGALTITNPVTSKAADKTGETYNFKWTNIKTVPEPSSLVLGLVALGLVGTGLAAKHQSKSGTGKV